MTTDRNKRSELASGRDGLPSLSWHDDERIQQYVAVGHELVQKSPLGHQLECFRDNVRLQAMPSSHPPGDWGYGSGTAYSRARETALRLIDAEREQPGAVAVLWAYCHPEAVALDGLPGNRGRIFAICPMTDTGRRARLSAGSGNWCSLAAPRLIGPRPCECSGRDCSCWTRPTLVRRLYAESVEAKGHLRQVWNAAYNEAQRLLGAAILGWQEAQFDEDLRRTLDKKRRRHAPRVRMVTTGASDG